MQIRFGNYVLADNTRDTLVFNFRITTTSIVQPVDRIRARWGDQYDRGNLRETVRFTVARLRPSVQDAERFLLLEGWDLKTMGKHTLFITGHRNEYQWALTDAVPLDLSRFYKGCTVFVDYTFQGSVWD